jgi:hypothetical protein
MAGIELCKFTHGLGLHILILPRAIARGKIYEYKGPAMESFVSQSSVNQIVLLIVFFLHVSQYSVLVKYMQMFMTTTM